MVAIVVTDGPSTDGTKTVAFAAEVRHQSSWEKYNTKNSFVHSVENSLIH